MKFDCSHGIALTYTNSGVAAIQTMNRERHNSKHRIG